MRCFFSVLLFTLFSVIHGLSSTGSRLLVVIEETADKPKYSQFWGDLEGVFSISKLVFGKIWSKI